MSPPTERIIKIPEIYLQFLNRMRIAGERFQEVVGRAQQRGLSEEGTEKRRR
jgi:hypothetical protein